MEKGKVNIMKLKNVLTKLLALGALTITISFTPVTGREVTATFRIGEKTDAVKPISYVMDEKPVPQIDEKPVDLIP